jgi:hypothetical protein
MIVFGAILLMLGIRLSGTWLRRPKLKYPEKGQRLGTGGVRSFQSFQLSRSKSSRVRRTASGSERVVRRCSFARSQRIIHAS